MASKDDPSFESIFDDDADSKDFSAFKFWSDKADPADVKIPGKEFILAEGTLMKKRDNLSFLWVSGYFVLYSPHLLVYYKSESERDKVHKWTMIDFAKCYEITDVKDKVTYKGFEFKKNESVFALFCANDPQYDVWRKGLRRACVFRNFHDNYAVSKAIGKGSFARVYLGEHKVTHEKYAIKAFEKIKIKEEKNGPESLKNEIDLMQRIHHPNIVEFFEVYESNSSVYIVMELVTGGELLKRLTKLGRIKEQDCQQIIRRVMDAIAHCHHLNIMHRDLKPENILLKSDSSLFEIRLADFGLATSNDVKDYLFRRCGTPGYAGPEVFSATGKYDLVCDVFSIAVIWYQLVTGKHPFEGTTQSDIIAKNKAAIVDYDFLRPVLSREGIDLMKKMFEKDPTKRITAAAALKHPYMKIAGDSQEDLNISPDEGTNISMPAANTGIDMEKLKKSNFSEKPPPLNLMHQDTGEESKGAASPIGSFVVRTPVYRGNVDSVKASGMSNGSIGMMAGNSPKNAPTPSIFGRQKTESPQAAGDRGMSKDPSKKPTVKTGGQSDIYRLALKNKMSEAKDTKGPEDFSDMIVESMSPQLKPTVAKQPPPKCMTPKNYS